MHTTYIWLTALLLILVEGVEVEKGSPEHNEDLHEETGYPNSLSGSFYFRPSPRQPFSQLNPIPYPLILPNGTASSSTGVQKYDPPSSYLFNMPSRIMDPEWWPTWLEKSLPSKLIVQKRNYPEFNREKMVMSWRATHLADETNDPEHEGLDVNKSNKDTTIFEVSDKQKTKIDLSQRETDILRDISSSSLKPGIEIKLVNISSPIKESVSETIEKIDINSTAIKINNNQEEGNSNVTTVIDIEAPSEIITKENAPKKDDNIETEIQYRKNSSYETTESIHLKNNESGNSQSEKDLREKLSPPTDFGESFNSPKSQNVNVSKSTSEETKKMDIYLYNKEENMWLENQNNNEKGTNYNGENKKNNIHESISVNISLPGNANNVRSFESESNSTDLKSEIVLENENKLHLEHNFEVYGIGNLNISKENRIEVSGHDDQVEEITEQHTLIPEEENKSNQSLLTKRGKNETDNKDNIVNPGFEAVILDKNEGDKESTEQPITEQGYTVDIRNGTEKAFNSENVSTTIEDPNNNLEVTESYKENVESQPNLPLQLDKKNVVETFKKENQSSTATTLLEKEADKELRTITDITDNVERKKSNNQSYFEDNKNYPAKIQQKEHNVFPDNSQKGAIEYTRTFVSNDVDSKTTIEKNVVGDDGETLLVNNEKQTNTTETVDDLLMDSSGSEVIGQLKENRQNNTIKSPIKEGSLAAKNSKLDGIIVVATVSHNEQGRVDNETTQSSNYAMLNKDKELETYKVIKGARNVTELNAETIETNRVGSLLEEQDVTSNETIKTSTPEEIKNIFKELPASQEHNVGLIFEITNENQANTTYSPKKENEKNKKNSTEEKESIIFNGVNTILSETDSGNTKEISEKIARDGTNNSSYLAIVKNSTKNYPVVTQVQGEENLERTNEEISSDLRDNQDVTIKANGRSDDIKKYEVGSETNRLESLLKLKNSTAIKSEINIGEKVNKTGLVSNAEQVNDTKLALQHIENLNEKSFIEHGTMHQSHIESTRNSSNEINSNGVYLEASHMEISTEQNSLTNTSEEEISGNKNIINKTMYDSANDKTIAKNVTDQLERVKEEPGARIENALGNLETNQFNSAAIYLEEGILDRQANNTTDTNITFINEKDSQRNSLGILEHNIEAYPTTTDGLVKASNETFTETNKTIENGKGSYNLENEDSDFNETNPFKGNVSYLEDRILELQANVSTDPNITFIDDKYNQRDSLGILEHNIEAYPATTENLVEERNVTSTETKKTVENRKGIYILENKDWTTQNNTHENKSDRDFNITKPFNGNVSYVDVVSTMQNYKHENKSDSVSYNDINQTEPFNGIISYLGDRILERNANDSTGANITFIDDKHSQKESLHILEHNIEAYLVEERNETFTERNKTSENVKGTYILVDEDSTKPNITNDNKFNSGSYSDYNQTKPFFGKVTSLEDKTLEKENIDNTDVNITFLDDKNHKRDSLGLAEHNIETTTTDDLVKERNETSTNTNKTLENGRGSYISEIYEDNANKNYTHGNQSEPVSYNDINETEPISGNVNYFKDRIYETKANDSVDDNITFTDDKYSQRDSLNISEHNIQAYPTTTEDLVEDRNEISTETNKTPENDKGTYILQKIDSTTQNYMNENKSNYMLYRESNQTGPFFGTVNLLGDKTLEKQSIDKTESNMTFLNDKNHKRDYLGENNKIESYPTASLVEERNETATETKNALENENKEIPYSPNGASKYTTETYQTKIEQYIPMETKSENIVFMPELETITTKSIKIEKTNDTLSGKIIESINQRNKSNSETSNIAVLDSPPLTTIPTLAVDDLEDDEYYDDEYSYESTTDEADFEEEVSKSIVNSEILSIPGSLANTKQEIQGTESKEIKREAMIEGV